MDQTFGEILESLIKKNNLSIRQFAQKIGVSPTTAQEWVGKSGRFPSSPQILKKISKYFDIGVHELLYGEPDPKNLIGSLLEKSEIHSGYYKLTIERVKIPEKKN